MLVCVWVWMPASFSAHIWNTSAVASRIYLKRKKKICNLCDHRSLYFHTNIWFVQRTCNRLYFCENTSAKLQQTKLPSWDPPWRFRSDIRYVGLGSLQLRWSLTLICNLRKFKKKKKRFCQSHYVFIWQYHSYSYDAIIYHIIIYCHLGKLYCSALNKVWLWVHCILVLHEVWKIK